MVKKVVETLDISRYTVRVVERCKDTKYLETYVLLTKPWKNTRLSSKCLETYKLQVSFSDTSSIDHLVGTDKSNDFDHFAK